MMLIDCGHVTQGLLGSFITDRLWSWSGYQGGCANKKNVMHCLRTASKWLW